MILFGKTKKLKKEIEQLKIEKAEEIEEKEKLIKDLEKKDREIKKMDDLIIIQKKDIKDYDKKCSKLALENQKLSDTNEILKKEKRQLQGAKGGQKAENNKLKALVADLTKKLEESMTDKYLVKKIPSGRKPKGPSIKLRSYSKQSQIIKNIHKD